MLATQIPFFPAPNHPLTRPTVSGHLGMAVSCIVDSCLLASSTRPTAPPYLFHPALPSGTLGILITLPAHLKDPIGKHNQPRHHGKTLFFTFFWLVDNCHYTCINRLGSCHSLIHESGIYRWPPAHISLTVNEIELYTLESRVQYDMANCLRDEPLAVELWERLQFEMRAARDLEVLVREYRRLIGAQWERFRTRRYDRMFEHITQWERRQWERGEEVVRRS